MLGLLYISSVMRNATKKKNKQTRITIIVETMMSYEIESRLTAHASTVSFIHIEAHPR